MGALILLAPFGRWIAAGFLALAIVGGAYGLGHHKGASAEAERWKVAQAAEVTRQAAARAKALDAAEQREIARTAENQALQKQVSDYEDMLAAETDRPTPPVVAGAAAPAAACHRLSAADVDGLRKLQGSRASP